MMNKESLLKGCLLGILGFAAQWVTAQTFDNETVTAIWGMPMNRHKPLSAMSMLLVRLLLSWGRK